MQYFEGDVLYEAVPSWAEAMLALGYQWRNGHCEARRIGLLSTPCDSEAAGLIALGALRRDLEREDANHVDTHFDLMMRASQERLAGGAAIENLPAWDVRSVGDNKCWRFAPSDNPLEGLAVEEVHYSKSRKYQGKIIPNLNGPGRRYIQRNYALGWELRGYPLAETSIGGQSLEGAAYAALPSCKGNILEKSLSRSYDGLVLVGLGMARNTSYMQKHYTAGFVIDGEKIPLGRLLTLHNHERNRIRRVRFVNGRAKDNVGHQAWLVIADGIHSLLSADRLFPNSDVIGVCNRDVSQDQIDQLGGWLGEKIRYYRDLGPDTCVGAALKGMRLRILQRRLQQ